MNQEPETPEEKEIRRRAFREHYREFLDRIPYPELITIPDLQYGIYTRFKLNPMSKEDYDRKFRDDFHLRAAMLLKAIEESWAPYDTLTSIREVFSWGPQGDDEYKIKGLLIYLGTHDLIERSGDRFRKKERP